MKNIRFQKIMMLSYLKKKARIVDLDANFVLVKILKEGLTSFDVFEKAIHQNLMIRDCSSFESLNGEYVRFCIMNPEDNDRLLDVFRSL